MKSHYFLQHSPPFIPVLSQITSVHVPPYSFVKITFTLRSYMWFLSFRIPHQNPVRLLFTPKRVKIPTHLILLEVFSGRIFDEELLNVYIIYKLYKIYVGRVAQSV